MAELEEHFLCVWDGKGGLRVGVWCLLVSAKPVREANTSRVKPDRLARGRDQRRRRTASGEKHWQTHIIKQNRTPKNIRTCQKCELILLKTWETSQQVWWKLHLLGWREVFWLKLANSILLDPIPLHFYQTHTGPAGKSLCGQAFLFNLICLWITPSAAALLH